MRSPHVPEDRAGQQAPLLGPREEQEWERGLTSRVHSELVTEWLGTKVVQPPCSSGVMAEHMAQDYIQLVLDDGP